MKESNRQRRALCFVPSVAVALLGVLLICGAFYWSLARVSEGDLKGYSKLVESSQPNQGPVAKTTTHVRRDLQKDLYFNRHAGTEQFRLKSGEARVMLVARGSHHHVVEHLEQVCCWYQEELFYRFADGSTLSTQEPLGGALAPVAVAFHAQPRQRLLYLEADLAVYNYQLQNFIAKDARLWRYELPGHQLEEQVDKAHALFSGVADQVDISFGDHGILFQAGGFKAILSPTESQK